jgi:hypothetical protein
MIIGISGKKQHGKDTVCKLIQYFITKQKRELWPEKSDAEAFRMFSGLSDADRFLHSGFERKLFAGKLKQIVAILIGCTVEDLEDNDFKEKSLGPEWRVWYAYHYKLRNNHNPTGRVSPLFSLKSEALEYVELTKQKQGGLWASGVETYILTPRLLLQYIGTEGGRNLIHPNIWVNALFADYKEIIENHIGKAIRGADGNWYVPKDHPIAKGELLQISSDTFEWAVNKGYPDWIITDVRFPNEVEKIVENKGIVLKVINPRIQAIDQHPSETALDHYKDFQKEIINDGYISDLALKVRELLKYYQILKPIQHGEQNNVSTSL